MYPAGWLVDSSVLRSYGDSYRVTVVKALGVSEVTDHLRQILTRPPVVVRSVALGLLGFILGSAIQQATDGHWFGASSWLFMFILACSPLSEAFYRSRLSRRSPSH